jgi:DNA polymerase-3 subunit delta
MAKEPPVIYLLHGEDEFGIAQFVSEMKSKLGDSSLVEMNFTQLDGRTLAQDALVTSTSAMPFLAKRRLVVLSHPLAYAKSLHDHQKFIDFLDRIPPTTALILIEDHALTAERDLRRGKYHWLESWARQGKDRVFIRSFSIPVGTSMARWIQSRAKELGGQFDYQAASLLASLIGEDTRLVDQEIHKLLVYVNEQRPVEVDDVEHLTSYGLEGDIFALVDALGNRNGKIASTMFHRLLEAEDPLRIFGMVVRQFRLLLLAREVLDAGGTEHDVTGQLRIHPYVAKKVTEQSREFAISNLEGTFRSLLEIDQAIKTSQIEASLAMDVFIAKQS